MSDFFWCGRPPTTKEEWWSLLDKHWKVLNDILAHYLDYRAYMDYSGKPTERTMEQIVFDLKEQRNPDIARYLNSAWWQAPDSSYIHSIPGWGLLCDLCSEEYVLYDDDQGSSNSVGQTGADEFRSYTEDFNPFE